MLKLGVDLGGTNIAAAIIDENFRILSRATCPTRDDPSPDGVCRAIARLCVSCTESLGVKMEDIESIGVGSPGLIDSDRGVIERWSNLDFTDVHLGEKLTALLNKPVKVENDANCAALGEYYAGAGKGCRDFAAITLGTGIGSGAIIGGKLFTGFNHSAFELGHTVIDKNGPLCTCGRRGCFETLASATALIRMTTEAARNNPESLLAKAEKIDGTTVFSAMEKGDSVAKAVFTEYIDNLACGVANLINILQPQRLCIGGGISNAGDKLLIPLKAAIDREDYAKNNVKRTEVVLAKLKNDAGIIGAAML